MVEAALVFPIVILAIASMIYLLIFFYNQVSVQSDMHISLSREAGELNETKEYLTKTAQVFTVQNKNKRVFYEDEIKFLPKGLLRGISKALEGKQYIVDGRSIVRKADLVE